MMTNYGSLKKSVYAALLLFLIIPLFSYSAVRSPQERQALEKLLYNHLTSELNIPEVIVVVDEEGVAVAFSPADNDPEILRGQTVLVAVSAAAAIPDAESINLIIHCGGAPIGNLTIPAGAVRRLQEGEISYTLFCRQWLIETVPLPFRFPTALLDPIIASDSVWLQSTVQKRSPEKIYADFSPGPLAFHCLEFYEGAGIKIATTAVKTVAAVIDFGSSATAKTFIQALAQQRVNSGSADRGQLPLMLKTETAPPFVSYADRLGSLVFLLQGPPVLVKKGLKALKKQEINSPFQQESGPIKISQLLKTPNSYIDRQVKVTGRVVGRFPAGKNRKPAAVYLLQESDTLQKIEVHTSTMPGILEYLTVSGRVVTAPRSKIVIKESERRPPPSEQSPLSLLAVGSALSFLIFLVIFLLAGGRKANRRENPRTPSVKAEKRGFPAVPPAPLPDEVAAHVTYSASLTIEKGEKIGKTVVLRKPITTMGRKGGRKNLIEIADHTVSRQQGMIIIDPLENRYYFLDESRTNPTKLNGIAIRGKNLLSNNDLLEMGETAFRFKIH